MQPSLWLDKTKGKHYPSITENTSIHTLIVGAGMCGLTTAYYLSNVTNNMIIVEADEIGYGASGRNTGKLSAQHGMIYKELIATHGIEKAKAYYEAQCDAIDSVESIVEHHQINCDFQRCSSTIFTKDELEIAKFQEEYQACLDLDIDCEYVEEVMYPFSITAGIRFHKQAKFNPYRYMLGLSDVLDEAEIAIYEHSAVKHVIKDAQGYRILVNDICIHAQHVILATQFPIVDHLHLYFSRTYPQVTSIAAFPYQHKLSEDMLINTLEPIQSYNRISLDDTPYVLCAGNVHPCGKEDKKSCDAWLHEIQKDWQIKTIPYHWSTQDYISLDKLPLIGPLDKGEELYFATAFQKWGNTNANIAGKILSAYILKQESIYQPLFHPHRKSNLLSTKFLKANFYTMIQFLKSKFPHFDQHYPKIGGASVIKLDHHTYGMYRDKDDELYIVDITCPHLGCVCSFNDVDKSWDCPCHGSRFTYTGEILKGPSTNSLRAYGDGLNTIDPHIFEPKEVQDES